VTTVLISLAVATAAVAVVASRTRMIAGGREPQTAPQHEWTGWTLLDEPGISDLDHGRWQRAHVVCTRCEEERDVWKSIARDAPSLVDGCPR
jgi:hypothetical protein